MLSAFMGLLAYMARYLGTRKRGKVNCSQAFEAFNDVGLHISKLRLGGGGGVGSNVALAY